MKNKQTITRLAATCAGMMLATALEANAQQDNGAFNAGVKAAQEDAQFIQGVQSAGGQASSAEEALMERLRNATPGVTEPSYDDNGKLTKLFIVIKQDISTSTSRNLATNIARKKASLSAKAELVKWLRSSVRVNDQNELVNAEQEKGVSNGAGSAAANESATSQAFREVQGSQAEGFARAIFGKKEEIDKDGNLLAIFGWSAKGNAGAMSVEAEVNKVNPQAEANRTSAQNANSNAPQRSADGTPAGKPIQQIAPKKANAAGISDF